MEETEKEVLKISLIIEDEDGKQVFDFHNIFLSGVLVESIESEEITTLISGFDDVVDLVSIFNNLMLQTIGMLKENSDNSMENIVSALRESTDMILEGSLAGKYDDFFITNEAQN